MKMAKPANNLARSDMACKEINRALRAANYLTLVVRGHFTIEKFLKASIGHVLSINEFKDFDRLPFLVRVNLAILLGQLRRDSYPLLKVFNSLRNRFAHNPFSSFREKSARDMRNAFSANYRGMLLRSMAKEVASLPRKEVIESAIFCICAELSASAERRIREKIASGMAMRKAADIIKKIPKTLHDSVSKETEQQIEDELKKILEN